MRFFESAQQAVEIRLRHHWCYKVGEDYGITTELDDRGHPPASKARRPLAVTLSLANDRDRIGGVAWRRRGLYLLRF